MSALYLPRLLDPSRTLLRKSCFLLGPRQTGKSTLIKNTLKGALVYNLLDGPTLLSLSRSPKTLSREITPGTKLVVIDEIQKLPSLLDEVHLLIEERGIRFLLTGSSARKLRRGGVNLLGGRAIELRLHPLVSRELGDRFDLIRAVNNGLIPSVYFSDDPETDLAAYAGLYLKEEIAQEGLTRNIPAFSRFLEVAAHCHAKMINFQEISNDAQVARTTVQEYFQILLDTLIAHELPAWVKSKNRKAITTSKYYFFDSGVVRFLQSRGAIKPRAPEFGEFFETFIFHELRAFVDYYGAGILSYWRSTSDFEVDFLINDEIAVEAKGKQTSSPADLRGLKALQEEKRFKRHILVNLQERPAHVDGIEILPLPLFLKRLWDRELL